MRCVGVKVVLECVYVMGRERKFGSAGSGGVAKRGLSGGGGKVRARRGPYAELADCTGPQSVYGQSSVYASRIPYAHRS